MHWYTLTLSMQVPPLRHGLLSQSLMSEEKQNKKNQRTARCKTEKELTYDIAWVESGLTLVAVSASEALLALAAELAPGLAPAAAARSAHI